MAIKKTFSPASRKPVGRRPVTASRTMNRTASTVGRRPVNASTSITAGVKSRQATRPMTNSKLNANMAKLTPTQRIFANQLLTNYKKQSSIMGATNTSNIAAKPAFLELLPMFVQKLLLLDVFGSVAMQSRQQLVPYFKFVAEGTKGETKRGDILSSPFVNRQGIDPNFTGRVVKNEVVDDAAGTFTTGNLAYLPVLPGSVTITTNISGTATSYVDDGAGNILDGSGASAGTIAYATGTITFGTGKVLQAGDTVKATYQYDNETVGPDTNGEYGAQMGKGMLVLDEINMVAEAHELACYWSVYSAFAAQQEYGASIADMSKDAAFGELTAEINSTGFKALADAASYKPQYNWDASPIATSVVPTDYLEMFQLKLDQAASSVYQATRIGTPNYIIMGTNVASYIKMMKNFSAANTTDAVGPYKLGTLNNYDLYVDPNYDPNKWVMGCKGSDIRRSSALYGEYMPFTETAPITLANMSSQQGYASMYSIQIVNPASIVSGKIVGTF